MEIDSYNVQLFDFYLLTIRIIVVLPGIGKCKWKNGRTKKPKLFRRIREAKWVRAATASVANSNHHQQEQTNHMLCIYYSICQCDICRVIRLNGGKVSWRIKANDCISNIHAHINHHGNYCVVQTIIICWTAECVFLRQTNKIAKKKSIPTCETNKTKTK